MSGKSPGLGGGERSAIGPAKVLASDATTRLALGALSAAWKEELAWARDQYETYARSLLPLMEQAEAVEEAHAIIGLALLEIAHVAAQALGVAPGSANVQPATHQDRIAFDLLFKGRIRALTRGVLESRKAVARLDDARHRRGSRATVSPYAVVDEFIDRTRPSERFSSNLNASAGAYGGPRTRAYLGALAKYASEMRATSMTDLAAREGRTAVICAAIGIESSNEHRYFSEVRRDFDELGRLRSPEPEGES